MARPQRRLVPEYAERNDGLCLAYDHAPRYGWGTYPERGIRAENTLVWEEKGNLGNSHPMNSRLSTDSLIALVEHGRRLGMV